MQPFILLLGVRVATHAKRIAYLTLALVFLLNFVFGSLPLVGAQQDSSVNGIVFPYYDPNSATCGDVTNGRSNNDLAQGRIYMLGDSITVGSTPALNTALIDHGFTVQKINAVTGRAISAPGEGNETGLQAIDNDTADIAASDIVVVALGTNASGANSAGVNQMIDSIASKKTGVRIYWVNIFSPGAPNKESFNQVLSEVKTARDAAQQPSFNIIDTNLATIPVSSDNIHPTTEGQQAFAVAVAGGLTGNSTSAVTAGGCSCSLGGNLDRNARYQAAWNFFTSQKGLSEEAAAGIMGNLEAESGIDPHNTQNNAPVPDGPEIPIEAIRGDYGYGIAQWTSAGRQENLIAYASETNRSTGDLGLQLDFLWKEFSESYVGVLTTLQTPGVTVAEASYEVLSRFEIPLPFTDRGSQASRDSTTAERLGLSQNIFNEFSGRTTPGGTGAGCGVSGINIDLTDQDTSDIPCGDGVNDAGAADGYRDGEIIRIRLCRIGSTLVNSQIAASVQALITAANAAGARLSLDGAGGSYRDMQGQINTYYRHCEAGGITPTPPPYPKENWSDYTRCPGAAPPGYSNHQAGLGFDFVCNGVLIPRSYQESTGNTCFQWLLANAANYGLFEYSKGQERTDSGYEGWHWSVDGN